MVEKSDQTKRSVKHVIPSVQAMEGSGFLVHRSFPTGFLNTFDPFLLLDQMGPVDLAPGEAKGAPDHPHRGFETVTYILDGFLRHKDSQGNQGFLKPGDVQWMTAGSGVIHSELPDPEFLNKGGKMHAFQLWVNLPKSDKMIRPRYQDIPSAQIPVAKAQNGKVTAKVIAGQALGSKAVIDTRTPIIYIHFKLEPGASVIQAVPKEYNAFVYIISGEAQWEGKTARAGQMVIFKNDGDQISLEVPANAKEPLDLLLIAGVPLKEPVARYGPFVMNTQTEIEEAITDYNAGRMGLIQ